MYDISILMPAIRTHLWKRMYNSIGESCKNYSFELVLVSPFELPEELKEFDNIKLIKDAGSPSRAAQMGTFHCEGKLLYHCVDDAIFLPDAIDKAVSFYHNVCGFKDVVNMRYREGCGYDGNELAPSYWVARTHGNLRLPGIEAGWKLAPHHLINMEYFRDLGGWDCRFEYLNHPLHDLIFRVQADGGAIYDSPTETTSCDWMPERTGDHGPVNDAHIFHDEPLFQQLYSENNIAHKRIKINLNNWQNADEVWARRFKNGVPKGYEQLLDNGD